MKAVLLVDDEQEDAFLIQRAFRKANVANEIKWVTNLPELERLLIRNTDPPFEPVLLLLSINMPGALAAMACVHQRHPRLPIIAMTDLISDPSASAAREAGASGLLVKPITFKHLIEEIQKVAVDWLLIERGDKTVHELGIPASV